MVDGNDHRTGITRRKILGAMGGAVGVSTIGMAASIAASSDCGIPDSSGNYSEENYEWRIRDSDLTTSEVDKGWSGGIWDYSCEIRGQLMYLGANWNPSINRWVHAFTAGGLSTTQHKETHQSDSEYEHVENLNGQAVHVDNRNSDYAALSAIEHPEWVGGYPSAPSGEDADYSDVAFTVGLALAGMASAKLAVVATPVGIVHALANAGESSDDPDYASFDWSYNTADEMPCEGTCFARFLMISNAGESRAHIETHNYSAQETGGGTSHVDFWNVVDADPDDGGGCDPSEPCPTSTSNREGPLPGTSEYNNYLREVDAFEEIDPEEALFPIDDHVLEGPIYRAKNPAVAGGIGRTPEDWA